jgi:hypothetical protein
MEDVPSRSSIPDSQNEDFFTPTQHYTQIDDHYSQEEIGDTDQGTKPWGRMVPVQFTENSKCFDIIDELVRLISWF